MDEPSPPAYYRPSGRVDLIRFAAALPFAAAFALLVGYLLCRVYHNGLYIPLLAPLLAGVLVVVPAFLLVKFGRCRNRVVGPLAGLLLGAGMWLSFYQFDRARITGGRGWQHMDALPAWVVHRTAADRSLPREVNPANRPIGPRDAWGWFMCCLSFGMETIFAVAPAVVVGSVAAASPYSERHRRWMVGRTVRCVAGTGEGVANAALAGEPARQVIRLYRPAPRENGDRDELTIHYLPETPDSPVILSLVRVASGAVERTMPQRYVVIDRRVLTPEQAAALATAFNIPGVGFRPESDGSPVASHTPTGRVFPLPDAGAGQSLDRWVARRAAILYLAPPLIGLAIAGGLGYAASANWSEWGAAAVIYLVWYVPGVLLLMFARKLRVLIRSRPEAVVRADDPDAVFVVHLPRAGGHRPQVKNRLDIGLLKVDARRRLLLFEGAQERWVIPAEGVLSCELEECAEPGRGENGPPPLVILLANIAGQVWEGPLRPRPVRFAVPPDSELRRMAVELCAAVRAVSPGAAAPRG